MIDDEQVRQLGRLLDYARRTPDLRAWPSLLNEAENALMDRDYWRIRLLCEQVWPIACKHGAWLILKVWKLLGLKVTF